MNVVLLIMGKRVMCNRGFVIMVFILGYLIGDKSKRWLLDVVCLEDFFIVI